MVALTTDNSESLNTKGGSRMKSALLTALALITFFSSQNLFALQSCEDNFEVFDNTQVQTMESGGVCYMSVHPRNVDRLIYRDFLFDSVGLLMIFDSYGQGSDSETTAARNYHFFPRQKALSYRYVPETKRLEVTSPSGKVIGFNTVKSILTDISGAKVDLSYEVNPAFRGGVEITANDSVFMDGGFQRGQSPSQNPKGKIHFRDASNKSCQLVNADVYRYTEDKDAIFKFNDSELKSFLSTRCPQLR
jgi:hypothetical protein